jgi:hypothetical protein
MLAHYLINIKRVQKLDGEKLESKMGPRNASMPSNHLRHQKKHIGPLNHIIYETFLCSLTSAYYVEITNNRPNVLIWIKLNGLKEYLSLSHSSKQYNLNRINISWPSQKHLLTKILEIQNLAESLRENRVVYQYFCFQLWH